MADGKPGIGAWISVAGVLLGINAWAIGLLAAASSTGTIAAIWPYGAGGMLISTALGLMLVLLVANSTGSGRSISLWGGLMVIAGVILLLVSHWIAPVIDAQEPLKKMIMASSTGIYRLPDWVSFLVAGAGTLLLGTHFVKLMRG